MGWEEGFSWWRAHGDYFARLDPLSKDTWRISLWQGSTCIMECTRRFGRLTSAKAATDFLLRSSQRHRCDIHTCGTWLAVAT